MTMGESHGHGGLFIGEGLIPEVGGLPEVGEYRKWLNTGSVEIPETRNTGCVM